jgi:putative ABC transport system ATP-binding protein
LPAPWPNTPEILLLDEPTSALDEESKRGIEELVIRIMAKGWVAEPDRDHTDSQRLSCVLVTHDLGQATRLAQQALLLEAGRVVKTGSVEEVLRVKDDVP